MGKPRVSFTQRSPCHRQTSRRQNNKRIYYIEEKNHARRTDYKIGDRTKKKSQVSYPLICLYPSPPESPTPVFNWSAFLLNSLDCWGPGILSNLGSEDLGHLIYSPCFISKWHFLLSYPPSIVPIPHESPKSFRNSCPWDNLAFLWLLGHFFQMPLPWWKSWICYYRQTVTWPLLSVIGSGSCPCCSSATR